MDSTNQKKWYDNIWIVILLCLIFFPVGLYALWKNSSINIFMKVGVTGIIAIIIIYSLNDTSKKTTAPASTKKIDTTAMVNPPKTEVNESPWKYTENVDRMTSEKAYFATCNSLNMISFEFPYNGGSTFTLTVRQMGNGNELILQVSKGQFMPSLNSDEYIRVKFDDEKPLVFYYRSAEDGSNDIIFLNNSSKFLSKLKKATRLIIEAPFFQSGRQQIDFFVSGLQWNR